VTTEIHTLYTPSNATILASIFGHNYLIEVGYHDSKKETKNHFYGFYRKPACIKEEHCSRMKTYIHNDRVL